MEHNTITEEQRARAERNRQAALAKKRKRGQPAPPAASGAAEPAKAPEAPNEPVSLTVENLGTLRVDPGVDPADVVEALLVRFRVCSTAADARGFWRNVCKELGEPRIAFASLAAA